MKVFPQKQSALALHMGTAVRQLESTKRTQRKTDIAELTFYLDRELTLFDSTK